MIRISFQSYSIIPNFEKLNQRFSKDNLFLPLFSTLALIVCTPSSSLLNRVALAACSGIVALKGLLMTSSYVQSKIATTPKHHRRGPNAQGIVASPLKKKEREKLQNSPIRTYEPTPEERKQNYHIYERLICDSFPDPDSKYYDPVPYTLEQLESECEQWMEDSLDLSLLTHAYQKIFNLSESTKSPFYENFPEENKAILRGWKERFFTPGTKQYDWRLKYEHAIGSSNK